MIVLLIVASALAWTGIATASAPDVSSGRARAALPAQGLYEGCAPGIDAVPCIEHLEQIGAAGFRYVLNYSAWYGTPAEILRYADAAAALGLRLIWPLNHPAWRGLGDLAATYSSFATGGDAVEAGDNAAFAARAIGLVAAHPATWGFYIGDELPAAEAGRVRALSAAVRRLAPRKPQLYVARPGVGMLAPFARIADVAGADSYPVGSGDPGVRQAAQSARVATSAADSRTAMVLQAFSWSQYAPGARLAHYPTVRALQAMRDAAIQHAHPTMILWYSYQDILRSDHPERRWQALLQAAFAPPINPRSTTLDSS